MTDQLQLEILLNQAVYPVKICRPQPASITVDNKPVKGFSPDITGYSYLWQVLLLKTDIAVTPSDPALEFETIQAKSVPGSATITLTDYITVDKKELSVNFGIKSVSDEFNANTWKPVELGPWKQRQLEPLKNSWVIADQGTERRYVGPTNTAENIFFFRVQIQTGLFCLKWHSQETSSNNQQGANCNAGWR